MKTILGIIFIATALATVGCDNKDDNTPEGNPDETFAANAAIASRAEIELGILAREHGDNHTIRDFGSMMETEHTVALSDLQSIADQKNIALPTSLDSKNQQLKQRLMLLSGIAFDTAYINSQIKAHQTAIDQFNTESAEGQDSEFVAYATNNLPHLIDHLTKAQQVRDSVTAQMTAGRRPN
jgi:putative membrane protein